MDETWRSKVQNLAVSWPWKKFLLLSWVTRYLVAAIAVFLPLSHPHIWRQVDTLGVSLRYWLRWSVEPSAAWPLVPAILHSGDAGGLMSMEFPLLNIVAAPLFVFGPAAGTVLSRILIIVINIALLLWNSKLWRPLKPLDIPAGASFLMLPLFGLGLLYIPRFIPDVMAMLLVLAATAYFLRAEYSVRAGIILTLGLLIKPTAVIVLALLCLDPRPIKRGLSAFPMCSFAVFLTALYYLKVTPWVQTLAGSSPSLYHLEPQLPWVALQEFFAQPLALSNLLWQGLAFWGAVPLLFLLSWHQSVRPIGRLWLILCLQLLLIAALDGAHAFVHQYYFIGTMPTLCLILAALARDLPRQGSLAWARPLLMILGLGTALSTLAYELRPLWVAVPAERFLDFRQCAKLKQQVPDWPWQTGYVFRSADRPFPLVGLCMGERVGSNRAEYGLFLKDEALPKNCQIVASSEQLIATRCGPS